MDEGAFLQDAFLSSVSSSSRPHVLSSQDLREREGLDFRRWQETGMGVATTGDDGVAGTRVDAFSSPSVRLHHLLSFGHVRIPGTSAASCRHTRVQGCG